MTEEMNYIAMVLRGKHPFLRQHNYLLLAPDLYSRVSDREGRKKGAGLSKAPSEPQVLGSALLLIATEM